MEHWPHRRRRIEANEANAILSRWQPEIQRLDAINEIADYCRLNEISLVAWVRIKKTDYLSVSCATQIEDIFGDDDAGAQEKWRHALESKADEYITRHLHKLAKLRRE